MLWAPAVCDDEAVLLEERIRRLASLLVPLQVPVVILIGHRCVVIAARVLVDPSSIHVVRQLVHEELKLLLDERSIVALELRHRINEGRPVGHSGRPSTP